MDSIRPTMKVSLDQRQTTNMTIIILIRVTITLIAHMRILAATWRMRMVSKLAAVTALSSFALKYNCKTTRQNRANKRTRRYEWCTNCYPPISQNNQRYDDEISVIVVDQRHFYLFAFFHQTLFLFSYSLIGFI